MKLTTFTYQSETQIGAITPDQAILPLQKGWQLMHRSENTHFVDMLSFLKAGEQAVQQANEVMDYIKSNPNDDLMPVIDEVTMLSPVPCPESIRDCMAFEEHIINCIRKVGLKKLAWFDSFVERVFGRKCSLAYALNKEWYKRPVYYKSNRFSVVGTDHDVVIPGYADSLDYELEWGIFIGKEGKNIPKEKAHEYIAAYTVFNDFSARDIQLKEQKARLGPAKGKDFDTGNAIGPILVTPDEIDNPYALRMTAKVNGQVCSEGSTADMYWTFEDIIAYISQSETLYPGEFIASGTCSNKHSSGCGLETGKSLKPGDVVELEVEGIGVLRNCIQSNRNE